MSDKVQLIKEEIERIEQILDDFNKTHNNTIDNGIVSAKKNICKHIKSFIDSLPEEPANEDLEKEVINFLQNGSEFRLNDSNYVVDKNGWIIDGETAKDFARHFAEWQHGKDFDDLLQSEMKFPKEYYAKGKADAMKEMKETIQTEYEKGRHDMREEMMKDAVDATILDVDAQTIEFGLWPENLLDIKEGDRVKIIIVKEED